MLNMFSVTVLMKYIAKIGYETRQDLDPKFNKNKENWALSLLHIECISILVYLNNLKKRLKAEKELRALKRKRDSLCFSFEMRKFVHL